MRATELRSAKGPRARLDSLSDQLRDGRLAGAGLAEDENEVRASAKARRLVAHAPRLGAFAHDPVRIRLTEGVGDARVQERGEDR